MAIGKDDGDETIDQFYIEENTFCNDAEQEIFEKDEERWTNQSFNVENRFVSSDPNPNVGKIGHDEHAYMKSILSPQEMMPPNKTKKPRFWALGTP